MYYGIGQTSLGKVIKCEAFPSILSLFRNKSRLSEYEATVSTVILLDTMRGSRTFHKGGSDKFFCLFLVIILFCRTDPHREAVGPIASRGGLYQYV